MSPLAAPVSASERLSSLDVLRGFALLGILLMNITGFGLHMAAYDDPTVAGGATGLNLGAWVAMHILAEGKMRCLFSLLFGASILLMTSRLEERAGLESADVYFRRNFWLLLFGIVHAYLFWQGDVLFPYAMCALIIYPCRRWSPKRLLIVSGVLVVLIAGARAGYGFHLRKTMELARQADVAEARRAKPTDEQEKARKEWKEKLEHSKPDREALEKNAKAWRGSVEDVLKARATEVAAWHSMPYYHPLNWDVWSMMLAGMAFLKLDILTARRSWRFYGWTAAAGYLVGISVNSLTAWLIVRSNFDLITREYLGSTYDIGRLSIAMAHMSVLLMLCKANALRWLLKGLGAVGQMALSNYIVQSVICSTIFAGYGFALYGQLERHQLYYVVGSIWIVQMIVSPVWLRHFRFGPMEWAWRSLTYWKRQPFRVEPAPQISEAAAGV